MSVRDMESSDEEYVPVLHESDDDDDSHTSSDRADEDVAVVPLGSESPEVSDAVIAVDPELADADGVEVDEIHEENGDDDDDAGDYDDGMEEDESTASGANVRRPVSIQEFLAWRLLGRVPRSMRPDETQRRYMAYEDATPQSLTRGSLWQQIALATSAAGPVRRNSWAHFDSCLDASMDSTLQASRTAPYGRRLRLALLDAVRNDPRVAAAATYFGPHNPTRGPDPEPTQDPDPPGVAAAGLGDDASAGPGEEKGPAETAGAGTGTGARPTCRPDAATAVPATSPPSCCRSDASAQTPGPPGPGPAWAAATAVAAPTPSPLATMAAALKRVATSAVHGGSGSKAARSSSGGGDAARAADAATGAAAGPAPSPSAAQGAGLAAAATPAVPEFPDGYLSGCPVVPSPRMVLRREQGEAAGPGGGWSGAQMRHMQCHRVLPRHPRAVVDELDSRAYIGQFSADGQFFVAAFQDRRVRLYDVERGWRLRKDITTRMCRWTITDTSVSPDQRFVIYSSIIPVVHLVEVGSPYDCVSSIANITQIHEPLNFDETVNPNGGDFRLGRSFGIWSVQWSGDGTEIVAGTNDQSVVVMDVETKRVVARAEGHDDDVNAVTYADSSPNIIISGSDDSYIKVWDRRTMPATQPGGDSGSGSGGSSGGGSASRALPVGVLVGHTEGLTHLHARGDGRHVLSNAKDQTAKLWDIRMMQAGGSLRTAPSAARLSRMHVPQFNWDYRWQEYPAAGRIVRHPHDSSLQTYRGHTVQHTLIRAYFSPAHTTGQRFVYTGSVDGGVHVYDVVSGQEVEGSPFRLHRKLVRDVSWHPFEPVMATVSWDGTVVRWDAVPPPPGSGAPLVPGRDAFNDYY